MEPERLALWKWDAYQAVLRQVDVLQRLIQDADPNVRRWAVHALTWLPDAAADTLPLVRKAAQSTTDAEEQANAILSLAILGGYLSDLSDVAWLHTRLSPEQPLRVRDTAAISLAVLLREELPESDLAALLVALQHPDTDTPDGMRFPWHWRGLAVHASLIVTALRPPATESTIATLCQAAEKAPLYACESLFRALLSVVFLEPPPWKAVVEMSATNAIQIPPSALEQLTASQRQALQAIGRNAVWKTKQRGLHIVEVCAEFGLPTKKAEFRRLLVKA